MAKPFYGNGLFVFGHVHYISVWIRTQTHVDPSIFVFLSGKGKWESDGQMGKRMGLGKKEWSVGMRNTGYECWRNEITEIDKSGSRICLRIDSLKKKNRFGPDISLIMIRTKQIKLHTYATQNNVHTHPKETTTRKKERNEEKTQIWELKFDFSALIYYV